MPPVILFVVCMPPVILFVVSLMSLPVTRNIWRRMLGQLANNKLEIIWKEVAVA
jgi:hypothetical protein